MNDSAGETPKSSEQETAGSPATEFRPGTAEALADIYRDMLTNMNALRESQDKARASLISYMDRVVLLAGGTLTLTFSAVATIGSHLKETHQAALHIHFVTAACWLLVATILIGLRFNHYTIKVRHQDALQTGFLLIHVQTKLRLLAIPGVQDVEKVVAFPAPLDPATLEKKLKYLRRSATVSGVVAQVTLFAAFVLLTCFIQSNIVAMLS